jgi:hypothetical protein
VYVVVVVGDVHVGEIVRCWKLVTMLNVDVEIGCCWHVNVVVDDICWIGWLGIAGCWMLLSWVVWELRRVRRVNSVAVGCWVGLL